MYFFRTVYFSLEMIFFGNYQPPKLKHHARLRRIITSPEQNHLSCTNTRTEIRRTHRSGFSPSPHTIKYTITKVIVHFMGRVVGFEPTHNGTTIRGLNHLTTPAILRIFSSVPSISNQTLKSRYLYTYNNSGYYQIIIEHSC